MRLEEVVTNHAGEVEAKKVLPGKRSIVEPRAVPRETAAAHPGVAKEPLPQVYVVNFNAGAGHFCWEEKPNEYASLVAQWWDETAAPA